MRDFASGTLENFYKKDYSGRNPFTVQYLKNVEAGREVKRDVSDDVLGIVSGLLEPEIDDSILKNIFGKKKEILDYLKLMYNTKSMSFVGGGGLVIGATYVKSWIAFVAMKRYSELLEDGSIMKELKEDNNYRSNTFDWKNRALE